jgi:hypothetical protein
MADRSFGPGWPNCDRSRIVTLVRSDGLRLPIHNDLAGLVAILLDLTELRGYNVRPDWTWGYACRPIAGTRTPSNHSWGTAVDINAPVNPRKRPLTTNIPRAVVNMWKAHGFRWGGDYQASTPDPMHMEFMGTKFDAARIEARLRKFLGAKTPQVPHVPPRTPEQPLYPGQVEMGDRGEAVKAWQRQLVRRGYGHIAVDGIFGERTNHVVRDWQAKHGLRVDGIAGRRTWASLLG